MLTTVLGLAEAFPAVSQLVLTTACERSVITYFVKRTEVTELVPGGARI